MSSFFGNSEFLKVGVGVYQNLPEKISPMVFHIGSFGVGWYALMYIAAFLVVFFLLRLRIKKREAGYDSELIENFIFYSFLGVVIGGRLGYVLFYNLPYYLTHPIEVFLPIQDLGSGFQVTGFYGMSYHGGLIGALLATWYFTRKNKIGFLKWADFVVPAIPAGFFFGRLGNFLNGELYGRITERPWGMYFPGGGEMLRHPSQLYEAFFEGLVLFVILWLLRSRPHRPHPQPLSPPQGEGGRRPGEGFLLCAYLLLYGFFRFFLEFFRQPDPQLGFVIKWAENSLTLGQILSLGMVFLAVILSLYLKRKKVYN